MNTLLLILSATLLAAPAAASEYAASFAAGGRRYVARLSFEAAPRPAAKVLDARGRFTNVDERRGYDGGHGGYAGRVPESDGISSVEVCRSRAEFTLGSVTLWLEDPEGRPLTSKKSAAATLIVEDSQWRDGCTSRLAPGPVPAGEATLMLNGPLAVGPAAEQGQVYPAVSVEARFEGGAAQGGLGTLSAAGPGTLRLDGLDAAALPARMAALVDARVKTPEGAPYWKTLGGAAFTELPAPRMAPPRDDR